MKKQAKVLVFVFGLFCLLGFGIGTASAQLAQLPAKEYIERMDRDARAGDLKIDQVIAKLQLKPGDIVADIGSGSGAFSIPMAKAVAPNGILYAEDIAKDLLAYVPHKGPKKAATQIRPDFGGYRDP